jgi:hypothetical protein
MAGEVEATTGVDLRHSSSSPECRQRSYSNNMGANVGGGGGGFNRHAKQRSSLYIKLHRTSTVPYRLSILNENNGTGSGNDTG